MFRGGGAGGGGERGVGGIPMEGCLLDRGGVLTYGKRRSMCVLSILKFACAFEQANQSLLFTF